MQATPPGYAPPPPRNKGSSTWLVVLLAAGIPILLLVSILATLAIYGFRRYIANAKQAEARNSLGQIAKDAAAAYERESVSPGRPDGLCASASRSVPASASMIRGLKYQSATGDWEADASKPHTGFACLKFQLDMPQYYMYSYTAHGTRTAGDGFRATANGDLDGDGVMSSLWVVGNIEPGDELVIEPQLHEDHPAE